jgi:iron complex transport system ATP-binding protein
VDRAGRTADVLTEAELSRFFGVPIAIRQAQGRTWVSLAETSSAC